MAHGFFDRNRADAWHKSCRTKEKYLFPPHYACTVGTVPKRVAIFGGSFNPPGIHHRRLAEKLARHFDEVRVIPCGPRPDKEITNSVPAIFRAALADLTFGGIPRVVVDLFDLENNEFSRNFDLQARYESEGEVWHVVGTDLIEGGSRGKSAIQQHWKQGRNLWQKARFAVMTRPGFTLNKADLPPHHQLIEIAAPGSSTEVREKLGRGSSASSLVTPRALAYIERYGLYRAPIPSTWSPGSLEGTGYLLEADKKNPRALAATQRLDARSSKRKDARFILTIGGDGAMLRSIREHWRLRLPFFGINAGHLGFLMNRSSDMKPGNFPPGKVIFRQLPMLYLEFEDEDGNIVTDYGFNDAWIERSTSQSAWLEVTVNGVRRIPKLVSDGALVSTAAGSTAYARSMGASPLLADTPAWLLVGSNVMEPASWKSALLSTDTTIEVRSLDPQKRPITAFVDGKAHGKVVAFRARISRAAAVELAFRSNHDMAEKIAAIQFNGNGD